jgi:hypothetical protein
MSGKCDGQSQKGYLPTLPSIYMCLLNLHNDYWTSEKRRSIRRARDERKETPNMRENGCQSATEEGRTETEIITRTNCVVVVKDGHTSGYVGYTILGNGYHPVSRGLGMLSVVVVRCSSPPSILTICCMRLKVVNNLYLYESPILCPSLHLLSHLPLVSIETALPPAEGK